MIQPEAVAHLMAHGIGPPSGGAARPTNPQVVVVHLDYGVREMVRLARHPDRAVLSVGLVRAIVPAAYLLVVVALRPGPVQDVRAVPCQIRAAPCSLVDAVQVVPVVRYLQTVTSTTSMI